MYLLNLHLIAINCWTITIGVNKVVYAECNQMNRFIFRTGLMYLFLYGTFLQDGFYNTVLIYNSLRYLNYYFFFRYSEQWVISISWGLIYPKTADYYLYCTFNYEELSE